MRIVLAFAFAVMTATTATSAAEVAIPERYHGSWQPTEMGTPPGCAANDADIRIRINTNTVDLHEGQCTVREAATQDDNSVQVRSDCGQEDSAWAADEQWSLAPDADGSESYLVIAGRSAATGDYRYVYGRCTE
ncbi:hypothetical protein [Hyphomicrobium sp. D-2]|uniref:hypothetical protein n=1 Tax=Hyphomicrobium sp. D-2 TaxID=3041621 RepID=UPI0024553527|nr:hypothetical protein [Hyphomicrobium sp. D-2]MDH4981782.1 hypothetical protein [Hyphomicrobium sp. D-2]